MGTNLTIFQKGLILLAVPLLFQLVFFGVLLKMEWDQDEVERLAVHTKEVIAQTETSYRWLLDGVSYVRRIVITGEEPAAVSPLHDALEKTPDEFRRLGSLVADNPPQQAKVVDAAADAERLRDWLRKVSDRLAAHHPEEAVALARDSAGQNLLDSVRKKLDDFLQEEGRLDRGRMDALDDSHRRGNWLIGVGVVLSVLVALVVGFFFGRDVVGRLARLSDNVRRWGDKKEMTTPLSGRDEVARLDRVFRDMARTLREREQENEMFIYSVSHDLRSPLVNLQGFSEELSYSCNHLRAALADGESGRARALEVVQKEVPDSLHYIKTAVSRLSSIIDALLRLSRVGRVEYRIQPVNVEETARRVVEALGATIESRKAEVTVGPLPPAQADPTAVEQIFANLIGNAVHYLDPSRPGRVEVGALPPGAGGAAGIADLFCQGQRTGHPRSVSVAGLPRLPAPARRRGPGRGNRIGPCLSHDRAPRW